MIGYHGIHPSEDLGSVLAEGLLVAKTAWAREGRFWHLSIAETPQIAANFGVVVEVRLDGLHLPTEGFVGGELRLHDDIPADRIRLLDPQPSPDWTGFADPAKDGRSNHPTCLRLRCWEHPPRIAA